jgi:hypothetical protein
VLNICLKGFVIFLYDGISSVLNICLEGFVGPSQ